MLFHPKDVWWDRRSGADDMDSASAIFGMDSGGWSLVAARLHFAGGTGTAACTMSILSLDDTETAFNANLYTFADDLGTGTDGHISAENEGLELIHAFSFQPLQRLLFSWTNPDAGNMQWGIEVGMIPWSKIAEYPRAGLV